MAQITLDLERGGLAVRRGDKRPRNDRRVEDDNRGKTKGKGESWRSRGLSDSVRVGASVWRSRTSRWEVAGAPTW